MANPSKFLVWFKATGLGNVNEGLWIRAVESAAAGATYAANQDNIDDAVAKYGTGTLRVTAGAVEIPGFAQIAGLAGSNTYYNAVSNALQATPVRPFPLRSAHWARHNLLTRLTDILLDRHPDYGQVSQFFPASAITKGHDIIYRLHQIGYLVGHKTVSVNGGTTAVHQLAWMQAAALGPTDSGFDVTNLLTYFDIAHTISAPTGPFSIVALSNLARRTLSDAMTDVVEVGGVGQPAEPTPMQMLDGSWIDSINE